MSDHDMLIAGLARDARPVRRVAPAWMRALGWTPVALSLGYITTTLLHREATDWSGPLAWVAAANIILSLSLGLAVFGAALSSSVAGQAVRMPVWTIVALAAWLALAIIGIGVSRHPMGAIGQGSYCFTFVMTAGLPMIAIAIMALRRTGSLRPARSLALSGMGIGFMAFALLAFCHPIGMSVVDLLGHLTAALILCGITIVAGRKIVSA
ncbi:hypothetical protein CG471_18850 [Sphingobium sp. IP1]|uniref:NrsF family protein n=1 Tax=Sphingobium sp. IP1 TaxID=2021637 RepID=UPI000C06F368|nr:NrsF family protein [Sphingobium sp. IP1]PHP18188.1 hypothetical protein CG471_18850 [Sphingobium sp. IP1]